MATPDPNDDQPIALAVDPRHVQFLREYFDGIREGLLQDLDRHQTQLREPAADAAAVTTLDRWLQTLADRQLVGTPADLRTRLLRCLIEVDIANDFAKAIADHEAFAHLLRQLR